VRGATRDNFAIARGTAISTYRLLLRRAELNKTKLGKEFSLLKRKNETYKTIFSCYFCRPFSPILLIDLIFLLSFLVFDVPVAGKKNNK